MSEQPAAGEAAIAVRGLGKVYRSGLLRRRKLALESLDLDVPGGGIFGFVGHNGAGKTTTIKLLMGLAAPTAGTAIVLGRPIGEPRALERVCLRTTPGIQRLKKPSRLAVLPTSVCSLSPCTASHAASATS